MPAFAAEIFLLFLGARCNVIVRRHFTVCNEVLPYPEILKLAVHI